jgi:hypothetical protein
MAAVGAIPAEYRLDVFDCCTLDVFPVAGRTGTHSDCLGAADENDEQAT